MVCAGVTPVDGCPGKAYADSYPVVLDGAVVGWVESELAQVVVDSLRRFKVIQLQKKVKSLVCKSFFFFLLKFKYMYIYIFFLGGA